MRRSTSSSFSCSVSVMINNPFYRITIRNRTAAEIDFQMVPDHGPLPSQTPVKLPSGRYQIPILHPQDNARHEALGIFLDEWSKVEMQIARLLEMATGGDIYDMPALMNALGAQGQREALATLLVPKLTPSAGDALHDLLERLKANATKRNHIVHGYWNLNVVIADRNGTPWPNYRQFRRYDPPDKATRESLDGDNPPKNACKTYMFSIPRIRAIAKELDRMWHELAAIKESDLKDRAQKPVNVTVTYGIT